MPPDSQISPISQFPPPENKTKLLLLFAVCLTIIGIVAGVRIEQTIESSVVPPSLIVEPVVLSKQVSPPRVSTPLLSEQPLGTVSSSTTSISSAVPFSPELIPEQYQVTESQPLPPVIRPADEITAKAYIVGNVLTGRVYLSSNEATVMPVASMSKLITTIAATDMMSPTTTITITPAETNVPPDGSNLTAGETFTLKELLYPLLLDSSNIAAEAIASSSDRNGFLVLMSSYAWEVGMPTAYFADPSGINPHNHASADDMFALAKYLYVYRPDILAITRIAHEGVATTTEHGSHVFDSIHPFVNDPRMIGGKTGRTPEAGETMMTILRMGTQPIAFIIMGSDYGRREADTDLLIQKFQAI
jgi:D-alanyl-D-alanine carboxypeptidase